MFLLAYPQRKRVSYADGVRHSCFSGLAPGSLCNFRVQIETSEDRHHVSLMCTAFVKTVKSYSTTGSEVGKSRLASQWQLPGSAGGLWTLCVVTEDTKPLLQMEKHKLGFGLCGP